MQVDQVSYSEDMKLNASTCNSWLTDNKNFNSLVPEEQIAFNSWLAGNSEYKSTSKDKVLEILIENKNKRSGRR